MSNYLFLICWRLLPIRASGQLVINNFDDQPNPDFFRMESGSDLSFVNYSIVSDPVSNGIGFMGLEWQTKAAEVWGGWARVEEWYPDISNYQMIKCYILHLNGYITRVVL